MQFFLDAGQAKAHSQASVLRILGCFADIREGLAFATAGFRIALGICARLSYTQREEDNQDSKREENKAKSRQAHGVERTRVPRDASADSVRQEKPDCCDASLLKASRASLLESECGVFVGRRGVARPRNRAQPYALQPP